MLYNINARRTYDGGVYAQYQENGQAKDSVHKSWADFVDWLDLNTASFSQEKPK